MKNDIKNLKSSILIKSFLRRFAVLAAGVVMLVGGQKISDIWFVILFLAATTIISIYSVPPRQWVLRPLKVARFFPYFLFMALRGGLDVARRVFSRTVPTDPVFVTIKHDRVLQKTLILAWVISLIPGTASTLITEDSIVVHVIDKNLPAIEDILELQKRINEMFVGTNHRTL